MPIFEYRCPKCGEPFELLVKRSEAETPKSCPKKDCGGVAPRKEISTTNFQLVGGGWYKDGYS